MTLTTPGRNSDSRGEPPSLLSLAALPAKDLYAQLGSSEGGLSAQVASRRLAEIGPNELPPARTRPLVLRFLDQLTHRMAMLLWIAGILAFVSGTPELGWAIWAVIIINAAFSFWQEYRAERALAELSKVLPQRARALRDGQPLELAARELVPGDVVLLEEGDRVSADSRLVEAEQLCLDASVLTGESVSIPRHAEPFIADGSRRGEAPNLAPNLVFAGTTVASGRGKALVYATGVRTEFGKVAGNAGLLRHLVVARLLTDGLAAYHSRAACPHSPTGALPHLLPGHDHGSRLYRRLSGR